MTQIIYQVRRVGNSLRILPNRKSLFFLIVFLLASFVIPNQVSATTLNGRILLQVEAKGEAWYVNPLDSSRYYLGRPENAFELMRSLGLGASNKDIGSYQNTKAPARLSGRILLQVQDKGQAFYVNPLDLKLYYLGRPNDAFYLMRSLGLGITNNNLNKIAISPNSNLLPGTLMQNISQSQVAVRVNDLSHNFYFKYKNQDNSLSLQLSTELYEAYKNSSKVLTYQTDNKPKNLRDSFYGIFLELKEGDNSIKELVAKGREVAVSKNLTEDELLEYLLALIQYIPYDYSKIENNLNNNPFYPYESLYLKKGVCSDKTFLALVLIREMGYGGAILDFPEMNHSALGLSCPLEYSVRGSGYCFVETTNYFPPGVIPQNIDGGLAVAEASNFNNLFNDLPLGKMEIYQKSSGRSYGGMQSLKLRVDNLNRLSQDMITKNLSIKKSEEGLMAKLAEINAMKLKMDNYLSSGNYSEYNALVPEFNSLVNSYNEMIKTNKLEIEGYNSMVLEYNRLSSEFYQK